MSKKIKISNNSVDASFVRNSFDAEKRTIDLVWSVGSKGKRYSWSIGEYFEELSMKKGDVDLSRLNNGAPLLKDHRQSLDNVIGVVESASIKNKEGVATVRFSEREEHQGIIRDVENGIIKNVSVGYRVNKYEDVSKKKDETPTYRAVDWMPMELSFVAIGFDDAAQSRSAENENNSFDCEIIESEDDVGKRFKKIKESKKEETRNEEIETTDENNGSDVETRADENEEIETPVVDQTPVEDETRSEDTPEIDTDAIKREGALSEKTRQDEIRKACDDAGLEKDIAQKMITDDNTIEQARELIISELSERNNKVKSQGQNVEVMDVEKRELVRKSVSRAILHRDNPSIELKDGDRQFLGGSLLDTAREVLTTEGANVRGINGIELAKRALHHSSDFGSILENVSNKSLRSAYQEAPQTFMPFTRETTANDFKEMSRVQLGEGTGLEKVNEHGEYKHATLSESAEKYKVEKFGKILGFTWELLVNDDLDAFARVPAILGRQARAKESELIYAIINGNPAMADGNAIFSAPHGNLGTAGVISETTLTEAKSKMRLQIDLDGNPLNIEPKFLYVPTTLETVAKKFITTVTPNNASDVNVFANSMQVVVEPRVDGRPALSWYLMGEKGALDIVELARLGGQGPQMFTREGFSVDGMETKIRYVFGVKAIDHRGLFKNAGA